MFTCLHAGDSAPGFQEFGRAIFQPGNVTVPLLLPDDMVNDLREGHFDNSDMEDSIGAAAEAQAESIGDAAEARADSIAEAASSRADSIVAHSQRLVDSLREEGERRADSARSAGRGSGNHNPKPVTLKPLMLLVLDNYDSFTYNLVQFAGELGADPVVYRNDAISVEDALALRPEAIVISPGPCTPREAGISVELDSRRCRAGADPGVCLGHQAIGEAFGGKVVRAERLMHGKTTSVVHSGHPLFPGYRLTA